MSTARFCCYCNFDECYYTYFFISELVSKCWPQRIEFGMREEDQKEEEEEKEDNGNEEIFFCLMSSMSSNGFLSTCEISRTHIRLTFPRLNHFGFIDCERQANHLKFRYLEYILEKSCLLHSNIRFPHPSCGIMDWNVNQKRVNRTIFSHCFAISSSALSNICWYTKSQ